MLIQLLAAASFFFGAYDAYLTQRRMKAFGLQFEINGLVRKLATLVGPELAAIIGVLTPCVGWTYIFYFFNLPVFLAVYVGYAAKRFEIQLSSAVFEKSARELQRKLKEFGLASSTLHDGEKTPKAGPSKSNGDN